MVQAKMNPDSSDEKTDHDRKVFMDYLHTLSKEHLIALVDSWLMNLKIYSEM